MSGLQTVQRAKPLLGTLVVVRVTADAEFNAVQLHQLIDDAFACVTRVHQRMSYQQADSIVSCLNREASRSAVRVDVDTRNVLEAALQFAAASDGAFDPTIATALERWEYLPVTQPLPEDGADWRDIELTREGDVGFNKPLRIDLSGIAKGYAVDLACDVLGRAPLHSFSVNAGGDLRVGGVNPEVIGLRSPETLTALAGSITLRNQALATSGSYFSGRRWGSGLVSPLVDPKTGAPFVRNDASVTVRCGTCMSADALTKVVLFAAPEVAQRVLALHTAEAFVYGKLANAA